MSTILGIDLGATGAIAEVRIEDRALLAVHDMPVLRDGPRNRATINAPLLANIMATLHCERAFIEYIGARPTDGVVQAFAFGRSKGVVDGLCALLNISTFFITPPSWKRIIGIKPGKDGAKDAARSEAIRRWPNHAELFQRVKDDGRAEAALIAIAGLALGDVVRTPKKTKSGERLFAE